MTSPQRKWQIKCLAEGRCIMCERKATARYYCDEHLAAARTWKRNWYRRKVGIPDNAPLSKQGRPRQW